MNTPECDSSSLEKLPADVLAARLDQLMSRERHCLAEFLCHLAAFDQRRGYLELGYESLFVYCTDRLKMAKGTAYRRTNSAQLIARIPDILDYLRDGRLSITSLCELRDVLNEENYRQILERASRLNEDEIKLLAATLNPKAEVTESVRRVPVRQVRVIRPALAQTPASTSEQLPVEPATSSIPEPTAPSAHAAATESTTRAVDLTWLTLPPKPTEVQPLSGERYAVRMSVSKGFIDEFHQVRNALSHVVPGGKMEDVLRECMRMAREVCDRRMRGSPSARATRNGHRSGKKVPPHEPRTANGTSSTSEPVSSIVEPTPRSAKSQTEAPGSRHLPVAVRKEVLERDGGCCTFVGANGKRCRSRYQLQFHHKIPFARGGPATADNLTLHCARHNRHRAYEDYGASHMDRFVAAAPAASSHGRASPAPERKGASG